LFGRRGVTVDIIVCVKQVPDPADAKIDRSTNTIVREGVKNITNPFDVYGVEEAVQIKEAHGGKVTAISMGPPQSEECLREAMAMGADDAILISDRVLAGSDTLATSTALAGAISKVGTYDLIICGREAVDGDTGQTGPGIAEHLGIPHITYVKKIREISEGKMIVERMIEDGYEVIEVSLPALITVVKDINQPRIPSFKGLMRAKKATISTLNAEAMGLDPSTLGLKGSPTQVIRQFTPEILRKGEMLEGDPKEQAAALVAKLRETGVV
jgi:electron transfer flavoprotein beta subunit